MVFSYDVRGNITQTDRIIEGNPTPYTIKSTYDSLNRPVDLTYPDNDTLRHSYNSQGLLDSVVSLTSGTNYVSLDYNVLGQITSKKLGNNRTTTYIYHPQNFRLTDLITPESNRSVINMITSAILKKLMIIRIRQRLKFKPSDTIRDTSLLRQAAGLLLHTDTPINTIPSTT